MAVVNTISKKMPMLILFWSQTPVEEKGEKNLTRGMFPGSQQGFTFQFLENQKHPR